MIYHKSLLIIIALISTSARAMRPEVQNCILLDTNLLDEPTGENEQTILLLGHRLKRLEPSATALAASDPESGAVSRS